MKITKITNNKLVQITDPQILKAASGNNPKPPFILFGEKSEPKYYLTTQQKEAAEKILKQPNDVTEIKKAYQVIELEDNFEVHYNDENRNTISIPKDNVWQKVMSLFDDVSIKVIRTPIISEGKKVNIVEKKLANCTIEQRNVSIDAIIEELNKPIDLLASGYRAGNNEWKIANKLKQRNS